MLVFFGFILLIIFGLFLTFIFAPEMYPLERLGSSFILGLGILAFLMFFGSWAGFKLNLVNIILAQTILIMVLLPFVRKKIIAFFSNLKNSLSLKDFSVMEKIIVFAFFILLGYGLINTLYWPVSAWDALTLYDFRAKIFASTGSITTLSPYYYNYPLLTSLAHAWVYLLGGENPKFIYTMFYLSFILIFCYSLKKAGTPRTICLIFTLFLAIERNIFHQSMVAYTNFPYTVYFVTGIIYLYFGMIKGELGNLTLAALMIGLSTWIRGKEPFWMAPLGILIIYSLYKRKFLAPIWFFLIFFAFRQPWQIFKSRMVVYNPSVATQMVSGIPVLATKVDLNVAKEILFFLYQNVISSWRPVLYLFLIVFFLGLKSLRREKSTLFLVLIVANFLFLVLGTFFFAMTTPLEWREIPGSAVRMAMFFIPLLIFYIASTRTIKKLFVNKIKKK